VWAPDVSYTLRMRDIRGMRGLYPSDPMRNWTGWMPKRTDGSGVVRIDMRTGSAKYFRLAELPRPKDHGRPLPFSDMRAIAMPTRRRGANNFNYRIAYKDLPGSGKPHMVRFRLSSDAVMDTLQVLTNHLNKTGVEWLWLCNAHGNRISTSCFHSSALWGEGRERS
jgi:hypothetical protein